MTKPGICPGGSSQESGRTEESETHNVKGLLGHTKDFELHSVSGVETLKHVTRYTQCEEQPNPNSMCTAMLIIRPTRRGILVVQSLSHVRLLQPHGLYRQAPLSMGFSRQEYWSGLPFPSPGHLPDPGIEPRSPALQADSLPTELPGNTQRNSSHLQLHNLQNSRQNDQVITRWKALCEFLYFKSNHTSQ